MLSERSHCAREMPVLYVENARDNVAMYIRDMLDIEPMNKIRNIRGFRTFVTNFFVREGVGIGRGKDNTEWGSLHGYLFYMYKSAQ